MVQLPSEFTEKYIELLGEERAERLFSSFDEPAVKAFRLNPLKSNFEKVSYPLNEKIELIDDAYFGKISGKDIEHLAGYVYSQDPAAMFVAQTADVAPGDYVLDLCAAPGGKTTQLASKLGQTGLLVSNEIMPKRAKVLLENVERWGIRNTVVTNESPERLANNFSEFFSKIIVDAPCSGEGMFRKDHDAIGYWSQQHVLDCQKLQKEIVVEAYKMLQPGGELVYSTCTFAPEEDEQIVEFLLEEFDDLELVPIHAEAGFEAGHPEWSITKNPNLAYTARFWTDTNFGEGQFVAKLRKQGQAKTEVDPRKKIQLDKKFNLNKEQNSVLTEFLKDLGANKEIAQTQLANRDDHIFWPIINPDKLKGLRILRNGLELGETKKKRFVPHQHFAESFTNQAKTYDLETEPDFSKYAHGETVKVETELRGFVLVSYQGKVFSWGKIGNDLILKNFYPKGLRIN